MHIVGLCMQNLSLSDTIMAFYWTEIELSLSIWVLILRGKTERPAAPSAPLTYD